MLEIPSQKVRHAINCAKSQVHGVVLRLGGYAVGPNKSACQPCGRRILHQERKVFEAGKPTLRRIRVAAGRLIQDKLGNHPFVFVGVSIPPCSGDFLPSRRNQITAGPRGQITDHGGFNIDSGRRSHKIMVYKFLKYFKHKSNQGGGEWWRWLGLEPGAAGGRGPKAELKR